MIPTTRHIKTSQNDSTNGDPNANAFTSSQRNSSPALVACFLLPPEQVDNIITILQGITANSASAPAPLASSFEPMPSTSNTVWLTHFEAAKYLGVATSTLYRYAEQARIECRKIGNRLEYRRSALDRFKENQIRPARRSRSRGIIAATLGSGN
jgi:excisionase family DNA binding protein